MGRPDWPVTLSHGPVAVRPLRRRDSSDWVASRQRSRSWLQPWEATPPDGPPGYGQTRATFAAMRARLIADARAGRGMPFTVLHDGTFAGSLNVAGIVEGSLQAASIGYWVDVTMAGRGIMPIAVALVTDHCLAPGALHRIELAIRPENGPSLRVVEKLGFRQEGLRPRFLHIAGGWRDHVIFAMTREELPPGGLVSRLR